jgi:hypothetical protein
LNKPREFSSPIEGLKLEFRRVGPGPIVLMDIKENEKA